MKMNISDPIHPLCALFTKLPLDDMFECLTSCKEFVNEKKNIEVESVINEGFEPESSYWSFLKLFTYLKIFSAIMILIITINYPFYYMVDNSEVTSGLSVIEIPDYVKQNKKVVINENNLDLTKTDVPHIQNTKPEKSDSSDDNSTIFPSMMSTVSGMTGDYNSEDWRIFNSKPHEHERLKYSVSYTYDFEEVDEESFEEEIIEDEDFSFLMCDRKGNEDREDYLSEYDFMQNSLESHSNNNVGNVNPSKGKLNEKNTSKIIKKLFMTKLMDDQSKIEEMMIIMFNYQANTFPEYRLHSFRTSVHDDEILKNNPNKLIPCN